MLSDERNKKKFTNCLQTDANCNGKLTSVTPKIPEFLSSCAHNGLEPGGGGQDEGLAKCCRMKEINKLRHCF